MAEHIRANYESLHTWKGRYVIEDENQIDGSYGELFQKKSPGQSFSLPIKESNIFDMRFVVDFKGDALYSTAEARDTSKFTEAATGRTLKFDVAPFRRRSILTREHYLFLDPDQVFGQFEGMPAVRNLHNGVGRVAFRQEPSKGNNQQYGCVVDPRKLGFVSKG